MRNALLVVISRILLLLRFDPSLLTLLRSGLFSLFVAACLFADLFFSGRALLSHAGPASACMKVLHSVIQEGKHFSSDTGAGVLLVQAETLEGTRSSPLLKSVEVVAAYSSLSFGVRYFGSSMDRPKVSVLRSAGRSNRGEINHFAACIETEVVSVPLLS
ncbi:putative threonine aspartase [Platanthera guangdongensis]|uniref:Threonine aspartase n=1 Tax=Platanthera guangdongensis TaxID=2320717 RepID=A0ABR2MK39_9ASPA